MMGAVTWRMIPRPVTPSSHQVIHKLTQIEFVEWFWAHCDTPEKGPTQTIVLT